MNLEDEKNNSENTNGNSESYNQVQHLSGMYQDWFLEYASYVILERAVPYIEDGLKPVQRRILHAMKSMDDGRYTKVANIIGQTMMYHPHGDASIGDALVQLGQKELLIDTQGNWGNTLTGDSAAAPRYIEARLSKFALEVLFNQKTTNWQLSYDGRNKEPMTLPVKFPLLLAQGVEGIAVGLASKILPHNFNELIDASISYLKGEEFEIYPDFPSGGTMDASKYNDGLRGGNIRVRAHIEKINSKTLMIKDIPFGKSTSSLIDSIVKANDKGKIKIKKIDDNTSDHVEILVHLGTGVSSDLTIDALYAVTDCEYSISPNSCIIQNDKPVFMGVSEILRRSADKTVNLLTQELEIQKAELQEQWHFMSLEKLFIQERIYKDKKFENATNITAAIHHIDDRLTPFKDQFLRKITQDDLKKLMEIRMSRILKFNVDKADDQLKKIEIQIEKINHHLAHIIEYAITYFKNIKQKFGDGKERKTEIKSFENIEATKVVVANSKLYIDYEEGFVGTGIKKAEYLSDCSDIDDIIVFRKDGTYFVTKVTDKAFIGKNILHVAVFKKNDKRTIYNLVYRNGRSGFTYMKRFFVTGVTRDKEYNMTQGKLGSRIFHFSANPNGEAEVLRVVLKPRTRIKRMYWELDFADLTIKGRSSMGNLVTKYEIHRITMKEKGVSTLGGRKIWYDPEVGRLNTDERGQFLGEFCGEDKILVFTQSGGYNVYSYELSTHFEKDMLSISKLETNKVYAAVFWDADQNYFYLKRFVVDEKVKYLTSIIGDHKESKLIALTSDLNPTLKVSYSNHRADEEILVNDFIGVKSYKARGKRVSIHPVNELEMIDSGEELEDCVEVSEVEADPNIDSNVEAENTSISTEKRSSDMDDLFEALGK